MKFCRGAGIGRDTLGRLAKMRVDVSTNVFDELTCPTCGGRIDGTGNTPCRCFAEPAKPARRRPEPSTSLDETMSSDGTLVRAAKPCRVCKKDLAGKPRLKDSLGYICKKCSDEEFRAEKEEAASLIECPECHRKMKPAGLAEYRGTLICKRCRADHDESDKLKVAKVTLSKHDEVERGNLVKLLIVGGVILAIAIYTTFLR